MLASNEPSNILVRRGESSPSSTLIAVGGGKGGIGKSFISSSLGIFLAHMGYKTLLVDLDLGGANLHTSLGMPPPTRGLDEFLQDPESDLMDFSAETPFNNLRLISGFNENNDSANISDLERTRLMSAIFRQSADFIVMDLAAGTHQSTVDFFLMAKHKLVVLTPEPSSIENAYKFMKAAFYRRIKRYEFQLHLEEIIGDLMSRKSELGIRSPSQLIKVLQETHPLEGQRLDETMKKLQFQIVLNQIRSFKDQDLGASVQSVCYKYFGTPASLLGQIDFDNAVWQALRRKKHLLIEYPHSRLYAQLMKMARILTEEKQANKGLKTAA